MLNQEVELPEREIVASRLHRQYPLAHQSIRNLVLGRGPERPDFIFYLLCLRPHFCLLQAPEQPLETKVPLIRCGRSGKCREDTDHG